MYILGRYVCVGKVGRVSKEGGAVTRGGGCDTSSTLVVLVQSVSTYLGIGNWRVTYLYLYLN